MKPAPEGSVVAAVERRTEDGLFVLGGAQFPTATSVSPTLSMVAPDLRAAPVIGTLATA